MSEANKRLINLSGIIFTLAFLIFAAQIIVANLPKPPYDPLAVTPERRSQLLARCREMKEELHPWAEKHKSELQLMLKARTSDIQKLEAVWTIAPSIPAARNGNDNDVVADGTDIAWSEFDEPVSFILFCGSDRNSDEIDESLMVGNEKYWQDKQQGQRTLQRKKIFYWSRFHDMPWIETMIPGREHFILWISGRITSQKIPADVGDRVKKEGTKPMEAFADFEEIEPPYDFLR
ncbi:MAG: hypothetical protein OHK0029_24270 [Armatimonadaceae bacterium]